MARSRKANQDVLDALSDVVTVSPSPDKSSFPTNHDYSSASYSGQAPMTTSETLPSVPTKDHFDPLGPGAARSRNNKDTSGVPPPPPAKGGMGKIANAFRRQTPSEKEAKRREKEKRMNKAIDDSTMKSSRMDIIDRLDLSGIHGSSLFHHDSPYDACSPHSNRNSRKAPVMAFDHTIDPMTGQPIGMRAQNPSNSRTALSPLAAATMRKMDDNDVNDGRSGRNGNLQNGSQIPTLRMDSHSSTTTGTSMSPHDGGDQYSVGSGATDRDADADRAYRSSNYFNMPTNVSKGKSDHSNPNADIWGVSSEPWQDFAQPIASPGGLRPGQGRGHRNSGESGGSGDASAASSVFDMEAVMTGKKPTRQSTQDSSKLTPEKAEGPKRSKSLIKKIKTARQNPNVPPPPDDELELGNLSISSDTTMRNNSSSNRGKYHHGHSPSSPPLMNRNGSGNNQSDLGRAGTLRAGSGNGYQKEGAGFVSSGPTSPGLGRKDSIFNRLRSGKNRERGEVTAR